MSSSWPPARASLDDSFAVLCESAEELKAAKSVNVADVIEQLTIAVESSQTLRDLVSSELPEATWQHRQELDAFLEEIEKRVEARAIEQRRSRLLALAAELRRGSIIHRRALRVEQLNQLRDQAIAELRSQAGPEGIPRTLPGPEADHWIEWACALQEPEDAEALQALRHDFAQLDDFVANLEPGMWNGEDASGADQLRSRLLALANELERGSITHHRALRVEQLNQLRGEAIRELRSQAESEETPRSLPGPEAGKWIEWACALKEPEDADSLRILRNGFAHLDDFIANLEPNMWTPAESPAVEISPEPHKSADIAPPASPRIETNGFDELVVSPGPIPIRVKAAKTSGGRNKPKAPHTLEDSPRAVVEETLSPKPESPPQIEPEVLPTPAARNVETAAKVGFIVGLIGRVKQTMPRLRGQAEELLGTRWRILLGSAALLVLALAVLGGLLWRSHRNHSSSKGTVEAAGKIPDVTASTSSGLNQPGISTNFDTRPGAAQSIADKQSKPTDQNSPGQAATAKSNEATLRPAIEIPQNTPKVKKEEPGVDAVPEMPATVQGSLPNPNAVVNIAKSFPTAQPRMAPQQVRVSSGVAEGLLIHEVKPQYPSQARQAHIQGTVVLQAVIGKDGSVQSVHAIRGPSPMLTQAAMDAVKQWKYKPYSLNGEAVEAETEINVKFSF